jgi:uncharacterized membrane protein YphA (DoxX/SURF4 family)
MGLLKKINEWSAKHNPSWLLILRVTLGICLFVKGFGFIRNISVLERDITAVFVEKNPYWLTTLIPWLHILGGTMIIAGLYTRLSSLVQIPILLGAVFFVNAKKIFISNETDLLFSIVILMLLLFFLFEGGGRLSLDHYFSRPNSE